MNTYASFKTDPKIEEDGVLLELAGAGTFTVARAGGGNKAFAKRLEALMKPHRRQVQRGSMQNDVAEAIMHQVYAETILLGWEGVTDEKGETLEFSQAAAKKLFKDLPDLFRIIQETAQDSALYRAELLETDAGN